jgi:hypothetical protein
MKGAVRMAEGELRALHHPQALVREHVAMHQVRAGEDWAARPDSACRSRTRCRRPPSPRNAGLARAGDPAATRGEDGRSMQKIHTRAGTHVGARDAPHLRGAK